VSDIYREAWEKLCKWRQVFAGWQLGTRLKGDPECDAIRDHREVTICLRAEVNALTRVLLEKKLISQEDLARIMAEEAEHLSAAYERKFPGLKAESYGISYKLPEAAETMKGWKP
jgi:hypothetical protein